MDFTVYKEQDMTGASATVAGKHGLVPAPEASKHTAFLRGDGTWVDPPVGVLKLVKTIQPENWQTVSNGFQYAVTDSKIKSDMDVVEAWLTDEETAMLGVTTFTCSTGVMDITTETKPTVAWNLTVFLV